VRAVAAAMAFQSAPGDEAGRNENKVPVIPPTGRFNPLPAMKPGGTRLHLVPELLLELFQSAPGDEAGRNLRDDAVRPVQICFNPLPAMKPGGTSFRGRGGWNWAVSIRSRR